MNNYCLYMHINKTNSKVYIGITCNIKKRWQTSAYKGSTVFYNALKKYGWDGFDHVVVQTGLSCDDAKSLEITMIAKYKSNQREFGYNVQPGGELGNLGCKLTKEQRQKISLALKGKYKGRHFSPSSEYKEGHGFTSDAIQKMKQAKLGKAPWNKGLKGYKSGNENCMKRPEVVAKFKGTNNHRARAVLQYSLDGLFIRKWDYLSEVQKTHGWNVANICACCKGRIKSAYGYRWEYADHIQEEPDPIVSEILKAV